MSETGRAGSLSVKVHGVGLQDLEVSNPHLMQAGNLPTPVVSFTNNTAPLSVDASRVISKQKTFCSDHKSS